MQLYIFPTGKKVSANFSNFKPKTEKNNNNIESVRLFLFNPSIQYFHSGSPAQFGRSLNDCVLIEFYKSLLCLNPTLAKCLFKNRHR